MIHELCRELVGPFYKLVDLRETRQASAESHSNSLFLSEKFSKKSSKMSMSDISLSLFF